MAQHGLSMTDLVWSIVLLDRDGTARVAADLEREPLLSPELGAAVPPRFADLERELRERAAGLGHLSREASATDGDLGRAFAQMASVCVDCHSAYLYGEARAAPGPRE